MDEVDQDEIARLASSLVHTVHQALALMDAENYGEKLRDLVARARGLHGLLHERMHAEPSWIADEVRTVYDEMAATLEQIEALTNE